MIRPAAALFDFDGTLIDREPLVAAALVRVCRSLGFEPPEGSLVVGRAWQDVHADLGIADHADWSVAELVARARAEAASLVADGFEPARIEGGADLIRRLAADGVPVAIVSGSTRAELDDGITQLGLDGVLAFHLGAEDYSRGKPHPECFLRALERLGAPAEQSVVFEDSTVGIAAGIAAGARVVAVAQANHPPDHPAHQDLGAADVVVPTLAAVTDDLLAGLVGGPSDGASPWSARSGS